MKIATAQKLRMKSYKKMLKAVFFVNIGVNVIGTNGCYDYGMAKRKADSYAYHRAVYGIYNII